MKNMLQRKVPAVYITTNKRNGTLYTGVTSALFNRVCEHKNESFDGFSKKYNCKILVYFRVFENLHDAFDEEKRIKAGSRQKKIDLINSLNPNWEDLHERTRRLHG